MAVKGAAMAIGATVDIETTPGYLPQTNNLAMSELWGENVRSIYGDDQFFIGEHRTGSTDMGDLGHIMPVTNPYIFGATGVGHGNDYLLNDKDAVYVNMAKLLTMTVIDLLGDNAQRGTAILRDQRPKMTKDQYLEFNRDLMSGGVFNDKEAS